MEAMRMSGGGDGEVARRAAAMSEASGARNASAAQSTSGREALLTKLGKLEQDVSAPSGRLDAPPSPSWRGVSGGSFDGKGGKSGSGGNGHASKLTDVEEAMAEDQKVPPPPMGPLWDPTFP